MYENEYQLWKHVFENKGEEWQNRFNSKKDLE